MNIEKIRKTSKKLILENPVYKQIIPFYEKFFIIQEKCKNKLQIKEPKIKNKSIPLN